MIGKNLKWSIYSFFNIQRCTRDSKCLRHHQQLTGSSAGLKHHNRIIYAEYLLSIIMSSVLHELCPAESARKANKRPVLVFFNLFFLRLLNHSFHQQHCCLSSTAPKRTSYFKQIYSLKVDRKLQIFHCSLTKFRVLAAIWARTVCFHVINERAWTWKLYSWPCTSFCCPRCTGLYSTSSQSP